MRLPPRKIMIPVAALLVLGNAWWFLRPKEAEHFEFHLEPLYPIKIPVSSLSSFPRYDQTNDKWLWRGRTVIDPNEFMAILVPNDPTVHRMAEARIVLPPNSDTNTFRRAILNLARHGICVVQIVSDLPGHAREFYTEPLASRITDVRDDAGNQLRCRDKVG